MVEPVGQDGISPEVERLRLVTAAGLFDGNDAAIHIMRRLIQTHAAEVIHLGHNRSVDDVVRAALQEDADGIVVSIQPGGHVDYFTYMIDLLNVCGAGDIPVFASSDAVFSADDTAELSACGVVGIYHTCAGSPAVLTKIADDLMVHARRRRDDANRSASESALEAVPPVAPVPPWLGGQAVSTPPAQPNPPAQSAPTAFPWWPSAPSRPNPPPPLQASQIHWEFGGLRQSESAGVLAANPLPGNPLPSAPAHTLPTASAVPLSPVPMLASGVQERLIGQALTRLESAYQGNDRFHDLRKLPPWPPGTAAVVGITGTGGAGKSSVTDELLMRFLACFPEIRIAVLSVDPTRRRSGGALLGDRIRMNALRSPRVYMRSLATRRQNMATSAVLQDCIQYLKSQDFDLVIVETAGIGQSDSNIVDLVDLPMYVMTSDYGAASQLEKIDMLDFAELIILNKYDQRGAADALRDIRQQWRRNRQAYDLAEDQVPVYPTIASQCNDSGMSRVFVNLCRLLRARQAAGAQAHSDGAASTRSRCDFNPQIVIREQLPNTTALIPARRTDYLAEVVEHGRAIDARIQEYASTLSRAQRCWQALGELHDATRPQAFALYAPDALHDASQNASLITLRRYYHDAIASIPPNLLKRLREWLHQHAGMARRTSPVADDVRSIPTIATPHYNDWGDLLRFLARENLPGEYPYTSGIDAGKPSDPPPVQLIADAGTPERANGQWHAACQGHAEICLVSRFDSVTLHGEDPNERLDIRGKIGYGGINLPTLDAMKKLYSGFNLCAPEISVAMSVNGPAPVLVAMLINTAIDQQVEHYLKQDPQRWQQAQQTIEKFFKWRPRPDYDAELPPGHNALGLGLLGISGEQLVDAHTYGLIKAHVLSHLSGRVRVDILEQEQANNTCIFSPEFSLRMLGDMQHYFAENGVGSLHAVSVSGRHFAECGASASTQLAFTLANGLTLLEYYLARGIKMDEIAPQMQFFFAIGEGLEYSVIGRVARRIWARAMGERYGLPVDSQKLEYDMDTPCHDQAITAILQRELGVDVYQAPWQGSFVLDALTDLVEKAVYREFEALNSRGGVLAAMGSLYQRDKILEEWMQRARATGTDDSPSVQAHAAVTPEPRSSALSAVEKNRLIASVQLWNGLRNGLTPEGLNNGHQAPGWEEDEQASGHALSYLHHVVRHHGNVFAVLLEAVKTHSLGQIVHALYAAGGEYRRTI